MMSTFTIQETDLFNNPETYEIEIEVDNAKLEGYTTERLEAILMKSIKFVLGGLQQTNYPISYNEIDDIGKQYLNLIKNSSNYLKPSTFIGPNSFTLQKPNILENDMTHNILNDYTVTDKADGLRKLMYIYKNGFIYLINTNMNIQFTGCKCDNNKYFNTIIDGEHIIHDKNGKYINLFACFDVYFINGKDVRDSLFVKTTPKEDKNIYRLLKDWGIDTFDDLFGTGYENPDYEKRIEWVVSVIENLVALDENHLSKTLMELKPRLEHNYNTFLKIAKENREKLYHLLDK